MGLFDVHAHLTHPRLAPDLDGVLARAAEAGLTTIIANGLNLADNQAVQALSRRSPLVKPAFGLYPVDAVWPELVASGEAEAYPRDLGPIDVDETLRWIEENIDEAIAIGEIGLDGYWIREEHWARQEEVFRRFVTLAMAADKPIIIHTRKRERRCFEVLKELGATRVDWHCFGSRVKLARQIAADTGHSFSIPANAHRVPSFRRIIETIPREQILLETDCPYLSPEKGGSSEPASVTHTLSLIAELWDVTEEAAQAQLEENFERLFRVAP